MEKSGGGHMVERGRWTRSRVVSELPLRYSTVPQIPETDRNLPRSLGIIYRSRGPPNCLGRDSTVKQCKVKHEANAVKERCRIRTGPPPQQRVSGCCGRDNLHPLYCTLHHAPFVTIPASRVTTCAFLLSPNATLFHGLYSMLPSLMQYPPESSECAGTPSVKNALSPCFTPSS